MYAYTVKFFVDKRGYEAAQKQYADPVLHGCLPELIAHMDGEDQETPGCGTLRRCCALTSV